MACPAPVAVAAWSEALDRGEAAVGALDPDALGVALAEADGLVPCLAAVAPRAEVARWFGLSGVRAFVAGDAPASTEAFSVARWLGGWTPPDALVGPIPQAWAAAGEVPMPTAVRPLPAASGTWAVDGTFAGDAPDGRPFLLQRVAPDGAVSSWRVGAHDPLPGPPPGGWGGAPPEDVAPPPPHRSRAAPVALAVGGAVAAGVGVGLGAVAGARRSAYFDAEPYPTASARSAAEREVNTLGVPAYGLVALGLGLGVGAAFSW